MEERQRVLIKLSGFRDGRVVWTARRVNTKPFSCAADVDV